VQPLLNLAFIHPQRVVRTECEHGRMYARTFRGHGEPFPLPSLQAAVQQSDSLVPQPAQQPPQAAGDAAEAVVVDHDLLGLIHAPQPQLVRKGLGVWQGMAAACGRGGTGEILLQVGVAGAGDVIAEVGCATGFGIGEREAAVQDDPGRVLQAGRELVWCDECGMLHGIPPLDASAYFEGWAVSCQPFLRAGGRGRRFFVGRGSPDSDRIGTGRIGAGVPAKGRHGGLPYGK
jgi:hypothetical protein